MATSVSFERDRVADSTRKRNGHRISPEGVVTTIVHEIDAPTGGSAVQRASARNANSTLPGARSKDAGTATGTPLIVASGCLSPLPPAGPLSPSGGDASGTSVTRIGALPLFTISPWAGSAPASVSSRATTRTGSDRQIASLAPVCQPCASGASRTWLTQAARSNADAAVQRRAAANDRFRHIIRAPRAP